MASFSVNEALPYLTIWVIPSFVLNLELGLYCEVHVLVSKKKGKNWVVQLSYHCLGSDLVTSSKNG